MIPFAILVTGFLALLHLQSRVTTMKVMKVSVMAIPRAVRVPAFIKRKCRERMVKSAKMMAMMKELMKIGKTMMVPLKAQVIWPVLLEMTMLGTRMISIEIWKV